MATDLEMAKIDPSSVYKHPADVIEDSNLSRAEKIDILRRWAYDEREKAVAEEENMQSPNDDKSNILDEILKSLLKLGVTKDQDESPPTKQG